MTELWARVLRRYRFKGGLARPRVSLLFRRAVPAAPRTINHTTTAQVSAPVSIHVRLSWPHWMPSLSPRVGRRAAASPAVGRTINAATVWFASRVYESTRVLAGRKPLGTHAQLRSRTAARSIATPRLLLSSSPPLSSSSRPLLRSRSVEHRVVPTVAARVQPTSQSSSATAPVEHAGPSADSRTKQSVSPGQVRPACGLVMPMALRRAIAVASPDVLRAVRLIAPQTADRQPPRTASSSSIRHSVAPSPAAGEHGFYDGPVARTFAAVPARQPDAPARADSAQPDAARSRAQVVASRPAFPTLPQAEVARLSEEVYRHIEKRSRIERERRGI
jgi:hypothetical protein